MIIYIHPDTPMLFKSTIPISLPALINRLDYKVTGYFHYEISKEIVKNSKIAIIDIHWYVGLNGSINLVKYLKAINPKIIVIAGGLSASMYAKLLVNKYSIDYVIRGDGEKPLQLLVESLNNNLKNLEAVPNILSKDIETPWTYSLTQNDIDSNDYYNIDFFPTFKKKVIQNHKNHNNNTSISFFPFLLTSRGCNINCVNCVGDHEIQKIQFKRNGIYRSSNKIKEDLMYLEDQKYIKQLTTTVDYISLLPQKYSEEILSKKYNLMISHEFSGLPKMELLEKLLDSFLGGKLYFSIDNNHTNTSNFNSSEKLIDLISKVNKNKNYTSTLVYNSSFLKQKDYLKTIREINKHTSCSLYDAKFWWYSDVPKTDKLGNGSETFFNNYINYSNKRSIDEKKELFFAKVYLIIERTLPKKITNYLKRIYYLVDFILKSKNK